MLNNANGLFPIERKPPGKIDLFRMDDLSAMLASWLDTRHGRLRPLTHTLCVLCIEMNLLSGNLCGVTSSYLRFSTLAQTG